LYDSFSFHIKVKHVYSEYRRGCSVTTKQGTIMLPYHLRAPRYGDKEETFKRRRDATNPPTEHDGGGPIQVAITNDLIHLRQQFKAKILNYQQTRKHKNNQPKITSDDDNIHWKSGTTFSIFKDVFRSSRIGMIHLLPPARCDREAYNQLIYAACLALFKESFNKIRCRNFVDDVLLEEDEEGKNSSCDDGCNYHDDAGFAIFSLYSLFETNPLPRQIDGGNPLENLPVSLRSLGDDPRTIYRRCFSQNIRIDRQQFTMLLRLKELSLAKKCDCERYFYELNEKQRVLLECRCGMFTDILEIIERIVPRLELCEYTGPFGIEAFAGHADYPYKKYQTKGTSHQECKGVNEQSEEGEGYSIESLPELSNDFESLIGNYEKIITAIRIPSSKSNTIKRFQRALEPIFSSNNNEQRDNTNKSSSISVQNYSNVQTQRGQNYKVILHDEIGGYLKKHLHASLMFLLRRDEPIPTQLDLAHHHTSITSLAIGDASSIVHGGVSVGTNQGQMAIQNLLSVVAGKDIVARKSRFEKLAIDDVETSSDQNLANIFLTSNQTLDHVASSDDEESVDSELTTLSFSREGVIEKDSDDEISVVSVATSTFGTKALENLLYTVAQEEENVIIPTKKRKRKTIAKKTKNQSKKKIGCNQDDETSVATSAFGTKALEDLLHTIAQQQDAYEDVIIPAKRTKRNSVTTKNVGKNQKKKRIENNRDDEISVATSAFGTKALQDLLHIVAQDEKNMDGNVVVPPVKRKLVPRKTKNQKKRVIDRNQDDEISVATSACGKNALKNLLQAVNQEEVNGDGNFTISTRRTKEKIIPKQAKKQKKSIIDQHQYDEISVATSACGKKALKDLLQTVNQEKC